MVESCITRLAATVSSGGIGSLSVTAALYSGLLPELAGFEIYGRRGRLAQDIRLAKQLDKPALSIHGRTGIPDDWNPLQEDTLLWVINRMTPQTEFLLSEYGNQIDILVHAPEFMRHSNFYEVVRSVGATSGIQRLWIENHPGAHGVDDAVQVVRNLRLPEISVNAGMMYDLFHTLKGSYWNRQTFRNSWRHVLTEIRQISERERIPLGLHIPIGTKQSDSLPVEWMDVSMWQDLTSLLFDSDITRIVFEHQFAELNALAIPFPWQVKAANQRLLELADHQLVPSGILSGTTVTNPQK